MFLILLPTLALQSQITITDCSLKQTTYSLVPSDGITPQSEVEYSTFTICSHDSKLIVDFFNNDQYIINNYNSCNDPLYKQDVNEIFIGSTTEYLEIEISPFGTLFHAKINNLNGDCTALQTEYRSCDEIRYFGQLITPKVWVSHLEIPIPSIRPLMANFFRINKLEDKTEHLSYNPTFAQPPCFHKPDAFIELII